MAFTFRDFYAHRRITGRAGYRQLVPNAPNMQRWAYPGRTGNSPPVGPRDANRPGGSRAALSLSGFTGR